MVEGFEKTAIFVNITLAIIVVNKLIWFGEI